MSPIERMETRMVIAFCYQVFAVLWGQEIEGCAKFLLMPGQMIIVSSDVIIADDNHLESTEVPDTADRNVY